MLPQEQIRFYAIVTLGELTSTMYVNGSYVREKESMMVRRSLAICHVSEKGNLHNQRQFTRCLKEKKIIKQLPCFCELRYLADRVAR